MKNVLYLVPKYLKGQKKRSLLALAGLVIAVALITATGILGASISASYIDQVKQTNGSWHASFNGVDRSQAVIIENHTMVNRAGVIRELGLARLEGEGLAIIASEYDAMALGLSNMSLMEGEMPQGPAEIALEEWILKDMGLTKHLGAEIVLDFTGGEFEDKKYTLTGILTNQSLSQITGYARAIVGGGALGPYRVIAEFREQYDQRSTALSISGHLGLEEDQVQFNEGLLLALQDSSQQGLYLMLGLIALVATVAVIHNVFHISVMERIYQYGVLRAIGTGPAQIRKIVLGEGLLLGVFAVPIGLLVGFLGSSLLVAVFSGLSGNLTRIVIPIWVIFWAGVICFAAILISAWKPARLASRVSPMDAMRGTGVLAQDKVSVRKRHIIFKKIFGINGLIAWRNLQRHRRQFNITVFSMSVCVVLVIVFSFYTGAADPELVLEGHFPAEFVLSTRSVSPTAGYTLEDLAVIQGLDGVTEVLTTRERGVNLILPANKLTDEYRNMVEKLFKQTLPQNEDYSGTSGLYGYSENILANAGEYLEAGEIDPKKMLAKAEILIINNTRGQGEMIPVTTLNVGDHITLRKSWYEGNQITFGPEETFKIAGILNNYPFPMDMVTVGLAVIMHEDTFADFTNSDIYRRIDVRVAPNADYEYIETALGGLARQISQGRVISYQQQIKEMEAQKNQLSALLFSLIGVIILISLFSIVNTISTNLLLRTRELGVLKAVGMTGKQMASTLRTEGLFYGLASSFWGGLAGNLIVWAIYILVRDKISWLSWALPWQATLGACAGAILTALLATVGPLRRISNLNAIDVIRNIY